MIRLPLLPSRPAYAPRPCDGSHRPRSLSLAGGGALGLLLLAISTAFGQDAAADPRVLAEKLVHLRSGATREWSDFPEDAAARHLELPFPAEPNSGEMTLRLRQQDVKQLWKVRLNDSPLGELVRDENDMVIYLAIPPGGLRAENVLRIESPDMKGSSDDIRVGEVHLLPRTLSAALADGEVEITVLDQAGEPIPCRITVMDRQGSLQTVGASSDDEHAVRPGTIYAARGRARFGLPSGEYTIYAGRGLEYSLRHTTLTVGNGTRTRHTFTLIREVPTEGYIACDTHVHTLTHSGHGDATLTERLITLAGEGIELPIATDHNRHIDYTPDVRRLQLQPFFTPVIGNEVTTSVGHFNVFPVAMGARLPDHRKTDWEAIFGEIFATPGVRAVILNHARDLHSGVRPFGPKQFNAAVGENLLGWPMRFNAMEVVNSGATQTDPLQLLHDWMALLNRGYSVTPVGSSDSHDVARHFVGQGRTYIRGDDRQPGELDVETMTTSFLAGHVLVSYGLIAELTIGGEYRSGDLAPVTVVPAEGQELPIHVRVLGPAWSRADQIRLYANGALIREETLPERPRDPSAPGVIWQATWNLPRFAHDVHLVAIATGPGIDGSYWKTAKPYQPTSPDWQPRVLGCSGAVWWDGDGDGERTPPRVYAERQVAAAGSDLDRLVDRLGSFDEATAAQAAHLIQLAGVRPDSEPFTQAMRKAPPPVQAGWQRYLAAWRDHQLAQAQP